MEVSKVCEVKNSWRNGFWFPQQQRSSNERKQEEPQTQNVFVVSLLYVMFA